MRTGLLIFFAVLLWPAIIHAQSSSKDSSDEHARQLFEEPDLVPLSPVDLFDYFENLPEAKSQAIGPHADPNISWIAARHHTEYAAGHNIVAPLSVTLQTRFSRPIDADNQAGSLNGQFLGDANAVYNRLRVSSSSILAAIKFQKQSWEPHYDDQINGYIALANRLDLSALTLVHAVAGDYALSFGQGLLFGDGIGASRVTNAAIAVEQRGFGVRPTLSNSSAQSFRGAAIAAQSGPIALTIFASDRKIDASISNDTLFGLPISGYHRTASELATKNAAGMKMAGASLMASTSDTATIFAEFGMNGYLLRYSNPSHSAVLPITGTDLRAASSDLRIVGDHFSLTSEVALSSNDTSTHTAYIASLILMPESSIAVSILYRHIPIGFISPFGQTTFGPISSLDNLNSWYAGVQIPLVRKFLTLSAYTNLSNELTPVGAGFPTQNRDYLANLSWTPSMKLQCEGLVRYRRGFETGTVWDGYRFLYSTIDGARTNIRFNLNYIANEAITLRSRFEHIALSSDETGDLVSTEFDVQPLPTLGIAVQGTRFQTDSYQTALYAYEPVVPGSGAILALYGKGTRLLTRLHTSLESSIHLSASLAGTLYDTSRTIGSGNTQRNSKTDFGFAAELEWMLP